MSNTLTEELREEAMMSPFADPAPEKAWAEPAFARLDACCARTFQDFAAKIAALLPAEPRSS
jgi:hypothetical protein